MLQEKERACNNAEEELLRIRKVGLLAQKLFFFRSVIKTIKKSHILSLFLSVLYIGNMEKMQIYLNSTQILVFLQITGRNDL